MSPKFARWSFTQFDMEFSYDDVYKEASYFIAGLETCPDTGRLHHQCYIEFTNKRVFGSVKKLIPGAHIESSKGGSDANIKYCSKDKQVIYEMGTPKRQGKRNDLEGLIDLIRDENASTVDLIESNPGTWARNYRALEIVKSLYEEKRNWVTEVIYIWGPAGCGKTRKAIDEGAVSVEFTNGFFAGYNGEDTVLLDDVDASTFIMHRQTILKLLDRYPYTINIKGGSRNWKPKTIYITSNYAPEEVFNWDGQYSAAISRRITRVDQMSGPEVGEGNTSFPN